MKNSVRAIEKSIKGEAKDKALEGIITYIKLEDGKLLPLSRYEDNTWKLPRHWFPDSSTSYHTSISFKKIKGSELRVAAKIVMAKIIRGGVTKKLRGSTIFRNFSNIVYFLNWLTDLNIENTSKVNQLIAQQYVNYVKELKTRDSPNRPLSEGTVCYRLLAVESCWKNLLNSKYEFSRPWPETTATRLAGFDSHGKPKTEIIPNEFLNDIFQHAESILSGSALLIEYLNLLESFEPRCKSANNQGEEKTMFLRSHGWEGTATSFNLEMLTLRDSCFLIILITTGIRIHELCNLKRNNWFSEIREGERYYFLGSRSDKTGEGSTHWLCPKIAIDALDVLSELMAPVEKKLQKEIVEAIAVSDLVRAANLKRISNSLVIAPVNRKNGQIGVLSASAINNRINKLAENASINWHFSSHQFRRTFASYVVHNKLGDLRYLREHFKHWSLDMTILYAMDECQDYEIYDDIYAAFDDKRQGIIGHWLEPNTPLSGGLAPKVRNLRDKLIPIRTYDSHRSMVNKISEQIHLRSTGIAWCTNDDGTCAVGQCDTCEHGLIDNNHTAYWEGVFTHQLELRDNTDIGFSGSVIVENHIKRCEHVLAALGVEVEALRKDRS